MQPQLTIAIAKGRLQTPSLKLFAAAGMRISEGNGSRCLVAGDETGQARFIFVKPADVPVYVEHGIADCGVVGRDVLLESEADVLQPLSLPIGQCRLALAVTGAQASRYARLPACRTVDSADSPPKGVRTERGVWRVATKYPRITGRFFSERGQPVEIIELSGSVELAPVLGLADCIVDLVETGRTLEANGLEIVELIAESSAHLIVNRASYQLKAKTVSGLIASLKEVCVSVSTPSVSEGIK